MLVLPYIFNSPKVITVTTGVRGLCRQKAIKGVNMEQDKLVRETNP